MNMTLKLWRSAALVLLAMLAGIANAQDDGAAAAQGEDESDSPLRKGAYVAPLASYTLSDKDSLLDDGFGGTFLVGYRNGFWAMEIGGVLSRISTSGSSATLRGGAINGLLFPFSDLPGLYGTAGIGGLEVLDYPTHDGSFSLSTLAGGAGYLFPLSVGNYEFAIRTEALYRHGKRDSRINALRSDIDAPRYFDDIVFNIGLQLPLGKKAPPPPPPEPVKVVEPLDTDGDGVIDSVDQCPGTPAGTKVNATGCPLPICKAPAPGERITLAGCGTGDTIVLSGVTFEFNQARLTPNAETILDNVADELKANGGIDVELGGHTDSVGSDDYNRTLSQERAQSVRAYLSQKGIEAPRLTAVGYGESQPVADNETDEGRELNRRVELKVTANRAGASESQPTPSAELVEAAAPVIEAPAPADDSSSVAPPSPST